MGMFNDYVLKKERAMIEAEKEAQATQKRMYANERDQFISMRVALEILNNLNDVFKDRLVFAGVDAVVKKAAEDIDDAMKRIYYTIPNDQKKTILHNIENATYATGVKTPGSVGVRSGDSKWGIYISYADMGMILDAAKEHCLTCMGMPDEQESCDLRKVYDRIGFNVDHARGECAYRELI